MKKGQKYQNKTAFKVQYQDRYREITDQAPMDRLCKECEAQIQWKIKYGKYKVPADLSKCIKCERKVIRKAYRKLCDPCSDLNKQCSKCMGELKDNEMDSSSGEEEMQETLKCLRERSRRTILRKLHKDQITWNKHDKCFVEVESGEQFVVQYKKDFIDQDDEKQWEDQDEKDSDSEDDSEDNSDNDNEGKKQQKQKKKGCLFYKYNQQFRENKRNKQKILYLNHHQIILIMMGIMNQIKKKKQQRFEENDCLLYLLINKMNPPRGAQDFINQRTSILAQKLRENQEDVRLEEYLRQKLIECRWRDDLKDYCKEVIRQKGLEKITIEELTDLLYVRGQATIPNKVKEDLLSRLRLFFEENQL